MKCPFCHNRIDDDSKFCPSCGADLNNICPKCGQVNDYQSSFCKKCGYRLKEENVSEIKKPREKKQINRKDRAAQVLSIISMSLMLLALLLPLIYIFSSFRSDDFYMPYTSTFISYITDAFNNSFAGRDNYSAIIPLVNGIILLVMLSAIVIVSLIFIGINIPKFVRSIKRKEFYNFSKPVAELFSLYLIAYLYFSNIVLVTNGIIYDSNFGPAFSPIIIITIILVFNLFVSEFINSEHSLFNIIFKGIFRSVLFVLLMIVIFNIGNARFFINATLEGPTVSGYQTYINDRVSMNGFIGEVSYFISRHTYFHKAAIRPLATVGIMSGIAFVFELVTLIFGTRLIKRLFATSIKDSFNNVLAITYSSIILVASILTIIFTNAIGRSVVAIYDIKEFGMKVNSFTVYNNYQIVIIVLLMLSLFSFIAIAIVEKARRNKQNEKAN